MHSRASTLPSHSFLNKPNTRVFTSNELTNLNLVSSQESIIYQPVKLIKRTAQRVKDNKMFQALDKTLGLEPVPPDRKFKNSLLSRLIDSKAELRLEFLIVVAMYNESPEHFRNTIHGILTNLKTFKKRGIDPRRIACIFIVDGIQPMMQTYIQHTEFFKNFFDPEAIKQRFSVENVENDIKLKPDEEIAHLFMQTISEPENLDDELQLIFCVKHLNKRKLNTHLWFFGGFCYMLKPRFVQLLDVGTIPEPKSLWYLYEAMAIDRNCAGCCGEIKPLNPNWFNIVEPAQRVEYKFSHVFDKALESVFGFISVLPGAFSAYRWSALKGEPLWEDYFMSFRHPECMDAYHSNIYLAEDRVLSLALVSRKNKKYTLRYVKKSVALTDVPDSISLLMTQRRRWINGSWFAMIDVIRQFKKIYRSGHSTIRKWSFRLLLLYFMINVIFTWLMVGSFFLALAIILKKKFPVDDEKSGRLFILGDMILLLYTTLILIVFIISISVKPRFVNDILKIISGIFGMFMVVSFYFMLAYLLAPQQDRMWILYLVSGTIAVFVVCPMLHNGFYDVMYGAPHFIFLSPTYINVFVTYAVCNTHDCTWGNRPDQLKIEEKLVLEDFEAYRTKWVIIWFLCNCSFAYFISLLDSRTDNGFIYISGLAVIATIILFIRAIGSILYIFKERSYRNYDIEKDADVLSDIPSEDSNITANSSFIVSRRIDRELPLPPALRTDSDQYEPNNLRVISEEECGTPQFLSNNKESLRENDEDQIQDVRLGYNIKQFREQKKLSIEELSRLTNIEARTIMGIEEGLIFPSITEYRLLKDSLNT